MSIAVAVAEPDSCLRELEPILQWLEAVRRLLEKLGGPARMKARYEAETTDYLF